MRISLKLDEGNVPVHSFGVDPVGLSDNLSQHLYMHEEYNIVILLVISFYLIFPYILVPCTQKR